MLNTGHFQELRSRPNVLLLGDSLGDLTMADGVQAMQSILKIGFLNDKVFYFQMYNFFTGSSAESAPGIGQERFTHFLFLQVEERKQSYLDSYDIVLVKDETMEVPNAILLYLTGNE